MRNERYSIEFSDDSVVIYGDLSIEETFDYLNFFEKKGFKSITTGIENSTLYMRRKSIEQVEDDTIKIEHELSEKFYENCHNQEKKQHEKTRNRVKELESLVESIVSDKSERVKDLQLQNQKLLKIVQLHKLNIDDGVREMMKGFGSDPSGTEVSFDWTYPKSIPIPTEENDDRIVPENN